ncbi:hypothetical protein [Longitalea luteola]|uniref:hypothetical protein n=1 Tax=Longitalea luteola TaxID=2812563 RepID=UPI001A96B789|nr:hypothetical protein [Longitalea luteola]
MKFQLCLYAIFIIGCNSEKFTKKKIDNKGHRNEVIVRVDTTRMGNQNRKMTFLDSVLSKCQLSAQQIQNHTNIDSMWYTGIFLNSTFSGDTIVNFYSGFKGAIINYDDGKNCVYKFLLIFSSPDRLNTDYKTIYSDCDHDESSDYSSLNFTILNDSTFETIEKYNAAGSKNEIMEKIKWRLNQKGQIDSISHP